jgi:hypothetical protein
MPTENYSVDIRRVEEHFEAVITELSATVTGTSVQEALENAQREIIRRKIERARAKKTRASEQKRTVA